MKKLFSFIILIFMLMLCAFAFVSCNECKHTNFELTKTEPSCSAAGKTTNRCLDCGYSYDTYIAAPLGHRFNATVTEPNCESAGFTTYICSCGESYISDYVSAQGHDYSKDVYNVKPTCTEQGYTYYGCSRCDYRYTTDHIQPSGHNFGDNPKIAEPTCESGGYTTFKCINCEFSYLSDFIEPLGHNFDENVTTIEPTCTEMGYTTYSCNNCDYTYVSNFTHPTKHTYTLYSITPPSCNQPGTTEYACECGDKYEIITEPTGHNFWRLVTMPTLSDMGYTEYTCQNENCGFTYNGDLRFYSDILPDAYAEDYDVLARGIDVSYHNYQTDVNGEYIPLDWEKIKASGVDYVIIRAGYTAKADGMFTVDETFELSYSGAKAAGLDVGVYFYTCATTVEDIVIEANLLISLLEGKQFEYPIYLDLEDEETYLTEDKTALSAVDAATLNRMCVEFFSTLQRAGYYTGLYVNSNWLYTLIDTDSAISNFEIWYARYPEGEVAVWQEIESGMPFGMWQYSDAGSIADVGSPFDFNYCYKDYPTLIKNGGFNGYDSDVKFPDSKKTFLLVTCPLLNVRSAWDLADDKNILGQLVRGDKVEVIEITEEYTKIYYNGQVAYTSKNPDYVYFIEIR